MGRKNKNVRQRNLPRAAQRQPKGQRTLSAQSDARPQRESSRQPSAQDRADSEYRLHNWTSDQ